MSDTLRKIVYVEDEIDIQKIVQLSLEKIGGFEVKIYSSGKLALEEAPELNPDLFLLDVMMPEIDGPSLLNKLREIDSFKQTPVIFVTAKAQFNEIKEYITDKTDVITKPFDPVELPVIIADKWKKMINA